LSKPSFKEVERLIASFKQVDRELVWSEKPSNSNFIYCSAQILDKSMGTVQGCSFEGSYRRGMTFQETKYSFTIFLIESSVKYRIFQLEIDSWDKITHRDNKTGIHIYGPHYHIGAHEHWDEAQIIQVDQSAKKYDFVDWLMDYTKKGNLELKHKLDKPWDQPDLI
jgi:hypothetical protein